MADQIASALSGLVGVVYDDVKRLFSYCGHWIRYAKNLKNNYEKMKVEAMELDAMRKVVNDIAKRDSISRNWISRVDDKINEVQDLEVKYMGSQRGRNRLRLHSNLSKSMAGMFVELHRLLEEGKVLIEKLPEPVETIVAVPKTEDKPSLHKFVLEIVELLRDQRVRTVGLRGIAGIGKTTIMQNVNNNENIAKMFNMVIWVTVSDYQSIEELRDRIAQRLKLEGITGTGNTAERISEELKSWKYLLLLDDVQTSLALRDLGICNTHADGKVVLATRCRLVSCPMDNTINVTQLSDVDAWKMFQEIVGKNINAPGVEPYARQVAKECSRIPILIYTIARSFRRKNNYALWRAGLESLRERISPSDNIRDGMAEFLSLLQYCYNDLDGDDKRACFLYSALYPEDCEIYKDYLLECWIAEGIIRHANKFRAARDRGCDILEALIEVSLLEKGEKRKHVRMSKVLRSMALDISEKGASKPLVEARKELEEPPIEEKWKPANRISLMDNKLCELRKAPGCKNLSTLLLQRNFKLTTISNIFFSSMRRLRVLDLHRTGITSLPESLSSLTCLRALYLNSCEGLTSLPSTFVALTDLEVLDIRGTGINNLPVLIQKLNQLRCLRISLSNVGMKVNRKVISALSSLEELSIDVDPYNGQWGQLDVEDITNEVASLTELNSLSFCFPKVEHLDIFIKGESWKDDSFEFQFSVGYHCSTRFEILEYFEDQIYKCLKFANGEGVCPAISGVLAKTHAFELIGHKGASKLSDFGNERMKEMRGCLIEGCDEIETIIYGDTTATAVFERLETMYIKNVPKLESTWEGPVHSGSLARLTTLRLSKCPKLKKIFSNGMIQQLSELQHLTVEECLELEEIIMKSENRGLDRSALPRLKTLVLRHLPELRSIWADDSAYDSLEWPSLERIKIFMCNSLTRLPFNNGNATNLRSIKVQQSWWEDTLQQEAIKERFGSICIFN